MYLSTKNIRTTRPSKKLDRRYAGPYQITEVMPARLSYRLKLSDALVGLDNCFHTSLLQRADHPDFPPLEGQHLAPPPPITIEPDTTEADAAADVVAAPTHMYEVEKILDMYTRKRAGKVKKGHKRKVDTWYKVKWAGYQNEEDGETWQPAEDMLEHAAAAVADFHHNRPELSTPVGFAAPSDWSLPATEILGLNSIRVIPKDTVTNESPRALPLIESAPHIFDTRVEPTEPAMIPNFGHKDHTRVRAEDRLRSGASQLTRQHVSRRKPVEDSLDRANAMLSDDDRALEDDSAFARLWSSTGKWPHKVNNAQRTEACFGRGGTVTGSPRPLTVAASARLNRGPSASG